MPHGPKFPNISKIIGKASKVTDTLPVGGVHAYVNLHELNGYIRYF